MDSGSFDGMTRLIARGISRRHGLRAAAAAIAAAALSRRRGAESADSCSDSACEADADCCSGVCVPAGKGKGRGSRGICRCVRAGGDCRRGTDCCQKGANPLTCKAGTCVKPARCIKLKRACTARDTCCAGVCTSSGSGVCCIPLGAPGCSTDGDCCIDGGYAVCVRGSCGVAASDARLKEAIEPLSGSLAAVGALRPVRWTWTAESGLGAGRRIGFIAQEVREVVPEAAQEIGGGYLGIDYPKLTAVLAGAVQEQQAEIAGLRARLAALESAAAGMCGEA
ncbi:MAG: tail fiber domain-containing protein [Chloroflexota bacterium]